MFGPFTVFNEELVIVQPTATTTQVLQRGAQTAGRNQMIESGMPPLN
jgi:hypothetical protein